MELPAVAGMDPRRVREALGVLSDGAWWSVTDLVRATATPRRSAQALLAEVTARREGDRYRLTAEQIDSYRPVLSGRTLTAVDPVGHLLEDHADALGRLTELIALAPRGRDALDHVAATPDTVVRRALLLGARFWLRPASVLCVGDHDLTSLAIAMINPQAAVTVVDIDERILAYLDDAAGELGLDVRTRWADVRLGLPPSVRGGADVAITDPPYSPDGVALFVARAAEGLSDPARGRVLLAYGASELTPTLALKVQHALHELHLVFEAVYPDFNRYLGAEAIGSAADLYVLRPTTRTLPAVAGRVDAAATAIYTRGAQAVESGPGAPPTAAELADLRPDVLVGRWAAEVMPSTPRARLSTWLDKPYAASARQVAIALPAASPGSLVARMLLASRADRVLVVSDRPVDPAELAALAPVYELTVRPDAVDAVRRPAAPGDVLRRIMDRAHGKLVNTWREALVAAHGGDAGKGTDAAPTRRQAKAAVLDAAPWAHGVTLLELPAHRLRELPAAVRASRAALG